MKRILTKNEQGVLAYVQMGIVILVLSALAIPITMSFLGATDVSTVDATLRANGIGPKNATGVISSHYTPATNVTGSIVSTAGTVLTLNPLAALVAVAAGMISLLVGAFVITTGRTNI